MLEFTNCHLPKIPVEYWTGYFTGHHQSDSVQTVTQENRALQLRRSLSSLVYPWLSKFKTSCPRCSLGEPMSIGVRPLDGAVALRQVSCKGSLPPKKISCQQIQTRQLLGSYHPAAYISDIDGVSHDSYRIGEICCKDITVMPSMLKFMPMDCVP